MPVMVNGVEITDEQVFEEMQYHPAGSKDEAMQKAAEALAIRELLLQEAAARGFGDVEASSTGPLEAEDKRIAKLLEQEITIPEADEASCRRFYNQNQALFTRNNHLAPFESVKEVLAEYLRDASWQTAVSQYLKILVGHAKIAGVDLSGADSPLVQ